MISALIATILIGTNSVSFTATATGVSTNTPLEFVFVGRESDRDYETLFLLEDPVSNLVTAVQAAGIPAGRSQDVRACLLWPSGSALTLEPALDKLISSEPLDGQPYPHLVYTGGEKGDKGQSLASETMPMAFFALYDCSQAPLLFEGIFPQGAVYGKHLPEKEFKQGTRQTFTLRWDGHTRDHRMNLVITSTNLATFVRELQTASHAGQLDVCVSFADELTVAQATAAANALAVLDSRAVKINGRLADNFFYRAFLPLVKWRTRKDRLTQPFEITLGKPIKLVFIKEDWSGEGLDPVLTPVEIPFTEAVQHPKTDTAFIFAQPETRIGELKPIVKRMPATVRNWYVYAE